MANWRWLKEGADALPVVVPPYPGVGTSPLMGRAPAFEMANGGNPRVLPSYAGEDTAGGHGERALPAQALLPDLAQGLLPTGKAEPPPANEGASEAKVEPTWLGILLKDDKGRPLGGVAYRVALPDGRVRTGRLDEFGTAYVSGVKPGQCQISFPDFAHQERSHV